jgi:PEP-CTERM motif
MKITMLRGLLAWTTVGIVMACSVSVAGAAPSFVEGFEDGNYTSSPPWIVANSAGTAVVTADPIRPSNLVLACQGTDTAHRRHETAVNVPWADFEFGFEFSAEAEEFDAIYRIEGDDFHINVRLAMGPNSRFQMYNSSTGQMYAETNILNNAAPLADWWSVHVWHDSNAGLVRGTVRSVAEETVLGQIQFTPSVDLATAEPITNLSIAFQETPWQYSDNITLGTVPEPATMSLLALGLGALTLRRRRR